MRRLRHHGRVTADGDGTQDGTGFSATEVRTAQLLVAAQFALIALVAVLPGSGAWPVPPWLWGLCVVAGVVGVVVMLLGGTALGRGLTAVPIPNRHAVLRTAGLYRIVRHPIYSGLLLTVGAFTVAAASWWRAAAFAGLLALISGKARWEEARLARRFTAYATYAARTPRFVPGWRPRG